MVCVLIGFTDKAFTKTQTEFNNLYNQVGYSAGGATGSVKDYYLENSYNQFNLTVDVAGPYTASQNMAYYGATDGTSHDSNPRALVTEAVNLANPDVNFADYDNDNDGAVDAVYIIYAGYGEEAGGGTDAIWAHAWTIPTVTLDGKTLSRYSCSAELRGSSGTNITYIGVICHEFGHVLSAPDYYDTNYDTDGQYQGTGAWDMMAGGSWNNGGATPAHHNGFTKVVYYDWATVTELTSPTTIVLNNAAENSNSFYKISTSTPNEYFLIENREKHLFDAAIPGSGMMIYHVHSGVFDVGNQINATHPQRMYPVAQNATGEPTSTSASYGSIGSATCAWTGASSTKTEFSDVSTPSSKSWAGANTNKAITNIVRNATDKTVTFDFMGGAQGNPFSFNALLVGTSQIDLSWDKNENRDALLVYNTSGTFGTPIDGTNYTAGTEIAGGGTVLYAGANETYSHTDLDASTTYYYKIYTKLNTTPEWSPGAEVQATTPCAAVSLPLSENFDGSTTVPSCWSMIDHQGNGQGWLFGTHTNGLSGSTGNYAYLNSDTYGNGNSQDADLVTPIFDMTGFVDVTLSFNHYFREYEGSAATLSYSIDGGNTWTQIQQWNTSTANPTAFSQVISQVANQAFVQFKWNYTGSYGYYWDIDDIQITGTEGGVAPDFTGTPTSVFVGGTVTFTNNSVGPITSWSWDFGDGASPATATGIGPHDVVYNSAGSKTVSLTVNDAETMAKTDYITVNESPFAAPRNLSAENSGNTVVMNWESPELNDDFEMYTDFDLSFGSWTQHDLDGGVTYTIQDVTFPNQAYTGSYIVFNPNGATPALTDAWVPNSGDKYLACFNVVTASAPNNDWLISPKVSIQEGESLKFFVKTLNDTWGQERYKVAISTTGTETSDFTVISTGAYVEAPADWTEITYSLAAYANQDIHFAIICVSNDAFVFMVDDIQITNAKGDITFNQGFEDTDSNQLYTRQISTNENPVIATNPKQFASYKVFRNDIEIGETTDLTYTDLSPVIGDATYYVKAVYVNPAGESDPSNIANVNYDPIVHNIVFSTIGTGGTISANNNGEAITSGSDVIEGTDVVFTATSDDNYRVKEWKLNDLAIPGNISNTYTLDNITADANVTVEFEAIPQYTLTISIVGDGIVNVDETLYSAEITAYEGTSLALEAVANEGSLFVNWTGDLSSINASETIELNANTTITANFRLMETAELNPVEGYFDENSPTNPSTTIMWNDASTLESITYDLEGETYEMIENEEYSITTIDENSSLLTFLIADGGKGSFKGEMDIPFYFAFNIGDPVDYTLHYTYIDEYEIEFIVVDDSENAITNAVITFDDEPYEAGDYFAYAEAGSYNYTVELDGYQSATGTIEVVDPDLTENVVLNMYHKATFNVESGGVAVEGASIAINNETISTDASGVAEIMLVNESYSYEISKDGFDLYQSSVTIADEDVSIDIELMSGIASGNSIGLKMYPNPVNDVLTIERSTTNVVSIEIYSNMGQLISTQNWDNEKTNINTENLTSGIYYIRISGENSNFSFVKN
ncbi:MAG: M6 family metalloprotease domain-containing protein [Salinivirgaceae bacterium]|nr:M6 family metalloprotease domain-containing protein [Salinivirgaceae bacterium]